MRFLVFNGAGRGLVDRPGQVAGSFLLKRGHEVIGFSSNSADAQPELPFPHDIVDLFDPDGEERLKSAIREFDPDVVWFICGTGYREPIWTLADEQIDHVVEVHIRNTLKFCQICAPSCLDGGPHLVLTQSHTGPVSGKEAALSAGVDGFLMSLVRGQRAEFAREGHRAKLSTLVLPEMRTVGMGVICDAVEFMGSNSRPMELLIE